MDSSLKAPSHFFAKACVDFEDGNEVQAIVEFDHSPERESTFGHPPGLQISFAEFRRFTGETVSDGFCGTNDDIVFWFNPETDIHRFYTRSGCL